MTLSDLPEPAPDIVPERLPGAWYVLVTNLERWRGRMHTRVEYEALAPTADGRARMLESQRFRAPDLLGRPRAQVVVRSSVAERPGVFSTRGTGLQWMLRGRSSVALADAEYRWIVIWYARSSFGARPGLCIHTRDPWISQARLDVILGEVRGHAFLGGRCDGLFAPVQHWIPPQAYRLG